MPLFWVENVVCCSEKTTELLLRQMWRCWAWWIIHGGHIVSSRFSHWGNVSVWCIWIAVTSLMKPLLDNTLKTMLSIQGRLLWDQFSYRGVTIAHCRRESQNKAHWLFVISTLGCKLVQFCLRAKTDIAWLILGHFMT